MKCSTHILAMGALGVLGGCASQVDQSAGGDSLTGLAVFEGKVLSVEYSATGHSSTVSYSVRTSQGDTLQLFHTRLDYRPDVPVFFCDPPIEQPVFPLPRKGSVIRAYVTRENAVGARRRSLPVERIEWDCRFGR